MGLQFKLRTIEGQKALVLRTSDRIAFKRCRRAWGWSSHLLGNLGSKNYAPALWFGSGIHYALEDYHGWNRFERPSIAFRAYCIATARQASRELPFEAQTLYTLGVAMLDYYVDHWLPIRGTLPTYWENGEPQVEVSFLIPIPLDEHPILAAHAEASGAAAVYYAGTIDKVAIDELGRLWVVEYKTAKVAEELHFQTDPQVSTYMWAAQQIYKLPVAGVLYVQFVKKEPEPPRVLKSGHLSTASTLVTSVPLYEKQAIALYGKLEAAPEGVIAFLNGLRAKETKEADRYIQTAQIYRNPHQAYIEAQKILLEAEDMLNPNLALYPNPTRDCAKMCSFLGPCVTMDDGGDWESTLAQHYLARDGGSDNVWKKRLPPLQVMQAMVASGQEVDIEELQADVVGNRVKVLDEPETPSFSW